MDIKQEIYDIVDSCLEKEMNITIMPHLNCIEVFKIVDGKHVFSANSYYDGSLYDCTGLSTTPFEQLKKKIQSWESSSINQ